MVGVTLGVLVLIVVVSVMGGFERELKSRILGFTPHIVVQYAPGGQLQPAQDWRGMAEEVEKEPEVIEAYAFAQDNVIIDFNGIQGNTAFRAIDTSNDVQMEALRGLLDPAYGGSAEMGIDEKGIVSETLATEYGLKVGDVVQLYSTRNFDEVMRAYKITEREPLHVEHGPLLDETRQRLREKVTSRPDGETIEFVELLAIYDRLTGLYGAEGEELRPGEAAILLEVILLLEEAQPVEGEEDLRQLPPGTVDKIEKALGRLPELDREKEDARVLKGIREIVLPKDIEVIGVYKASRHVLHPGIFVPLPTGQELKGLQGGVDGVALRIEDPYRAIQMAQALQAALPPDWVTTPWTSQYEEWFSLIKREKGMMYFVLSFIVAIAVFCVGAIMFTVTIQKKQEIGVMKALGALPSQIVNIFLFQGMVIGVLGGLCGIGGGLLVIANRAAIQRFLAWLGADPFPAAFHGISTIPAHVNPGEVILIALLAFVLSSLAGLVPAISAARQDAARSLRNL